MKRSISATPRIFVSLKNVPEGVEGGENPIPTNKLANFSSNCGIGGGGEGGVRRCGSYFVQVLHKVQFKLSY